MKSGLPFIQRQGLVALLASCVAAADAAPFQLVSVRDPAQPAPAGGSGDSWAPVITLDGRYVLFASLANNLVLGASSNPIPVTLAPHLNVFLRDRANGTTSLVSVNQTGMGGGNGDSVPTAISSDGRYALFESGASDLVPGDTNGLTDVFVRDMVSNITTVVSINTNAAIANGVCRGSTITPDGRFVAFVSAANNLVPGDTNGIPDVFVRDLQAGVTTLVSVGAQATNLYSLIGSESPDISPDGRYVAFFTTASNLVPGVATGGEIYLRDLVGASTTWVSSGARALLGVTNVLSFNHVLSADGSYVAYEATPLPPPTSGSPHGFILRYSPVTGLTDLIHTNAYVSRASPEEIRTVDMTPDGRFIAFVANTNGASGTTCILLWDAQSGSNTLVSANLKGQAATNATCDWPTLDPTGRFVGFLSSATNLVTNTLVGTYHLYVRDLQAGTTALVDADTNGVGTSVSPATAPRLSTNGNLVAFECQDSSLVPNDRNHDYDVFARDLIANTNELISAHDPSLPSASPNGPSAISSFSASTDGRWLAFASEADNLVLNDTNGFRDIFVRDLFLGSTVLASGGTNGAAADGICSQPALSGNGRYVAFTSAADNLVPGDTNRLQDVFVRDLQLGTTALVSVNRSGVGAGKGLSESAAISLDGRLILFQSKATDLAAGSFATGTENLFLRDTQVGTTYALTASGVASASMTPDGRLVAYTDTPGASAGKIYIWDSQAAAAIETNSLGLSLGTLAISPAGDKVVCFAGSSNLYVVDRVDRTNGPIAASGYPIGSRNGLRFSQDGRWLTYAAAPSSAGTNQVFLYDFQTQSNLLVSSAFGASVGANGVSDWPDISADGRFVAYRSFATNLLSTAVSIGVPNLYLYDRLAGNSTLLTANRLSGAPADNRSLSPVFSADGHTLFFQSWASDLVPQDLNHWDDVFGLAFLYVSVAPGNGSGQGPVLTWPARPGESYQVQFKDNLADSTWRQVTGSVTFIGNQAHLTDLAPSSAQRFYRVVTF